MATPALKVEDDQKRRFDRAAAALDRYLAELNRKYSPTSKSDPGLFHRATGDTVGQGLLKMKPDGRTFSFMWGLVRPDKTLPLLTDLVQHLNQALKSATNNFKDPTLVPMEFVVTRMSYSVNGEGYTSRMVLDVTLEVQKSPPQVPRKLGR